MTRPQATVSHHAIRTAVVPAQRGKHQKLMLPNSRSPSAFASVQGLKSALRHNPFHLPDCLNVALAADAEAYQRLQAAMCGSYAEIDVVCDAAEVDTVFAAGSLDYVVSSHLLQCHPNPIKVLLAWTHVLKPGGILFLIVPQRDAHPFDRSRPLTPVSAFSDAYERDLMPQTAPIPLPYGRGGHYHVYTVGTLLALVGAVNRRLIGARLRVEIVLETDDKVGNGHCLVLRKEVVSRN